MHTLVTTVATDQPTYVNRNKATISAVVTDGANRVAGASVHFEILAPNGTKYSLTAATGATGVAQFTYTVSSKQNGVGTYHVNATATLSSYQSGSGSTSFLVTR